MKNWKRSIKIAGLFLTLSNVPVKKRNPWANIWMMQEKAAELGIDLRQKYDTRLKR